MRKILFSLIIVLLLIATIFTIKDGFDISSISVWGVQEIIDEDEIIEEKNDALTNLVTITYPSTLSSLEAEEQNLEKAKKEYEDAAIIAAENNYYAQTEKYEIEFLWTKLGNYAKDENVVIKIEVVNSSTSGLYDLKFTVEGTYVNVTSFIYDIENDSRLGFTIEEFSMVSSSEGVQGTFTCKEIGINIKKIDENTATEDTKQDSTSANTSGVTNNTTQNTTTNTTNNTTQNNTTNVTNNTTTDNAVSDENSTDNAINNVTTNTTENNANSTDTSGAQ